MHAYRSLSLMMLIAVAGVGCDDSEGKGTAAVTTTADAGAKSDSSSSKAGTGSIALADAGKPAATANGETNYAKAENWLCRPGHNAACDVDLDTTIIKADGSLEVERFKANPTPPIDCFYVYPTVSLDTTPNSDLVPGPEEEGVVRAQFARFASQCKLYAPMYRQVSLTSLRASLGGMASTADRTLGYNDVLAAFRYYLEHDNAGRGVVLVGHSQGSSVLTQLIKEELDKAPLDKRFIAALLLGTNISVPKDKSIGGTFSNVPLCESANQLGCVMVYASFRSNTPPSDTALFARSMDPSQVTGCTNPAAIGGGSGELHAYLSTGGPGASGAMMPPWLTPEKTIATPFVSVPGLLTAECVFGRSGYYLAITVHGDPSDPRADDIVGDVVTNGQVQADWGLHLIDAHAAMGNLLDLVHTKAGVYGSH